MSDRVFGFIGCGNMGGALARAAGRSASGDRLLLANRTPEKAQRLADELGGTVVTNAEAAARSDYLFLGVKPQMMAGMLAGIHGALAGRQKSCVLVSMAAGLSIQTIRALAGVDYPVLRIMPNTPAAIGRGMVLCCADGVDEDDLEIFKAVMGAAGRLDFVEERLIDAGSCVAGCGPAFACLLMEALADGGVACGLPRAKAELYAAQMLLGTAALALEGGEHFGAMKDAVCSPGGSTIQGVRALEAGGFRSAAMEAVIVAYEKTLELGKA